MLLLILTFSITYNMQAANDEPFWVKFFAGAMAGSIGEVFTMPCEVMKTRMQLAQGSMCARGRNLQVITGIVQSEGPLALWKGVSPGVARQVIYCGGKLNIYEPVRDFYATLFGNNSLFGSLLAGGTAGGLSNLCSNPADLLKVRFQGDITGKLSERGLIACWKNCIVNDGVLSLWRGCSPTVLRAFFINSVELGGYDLSKKWLLSYFPGSDDNIWLHFSSGAISGVLAAFISLPFDVIKSRMMISGSQFTSIGDCVRVTVKHEGFGAFFKGFVPVASRIVPFNIVQFIVFERVRAFLSKDVNNLYSI